VGSVGGLPGLLPGLPGWHELPGCRAISTPRTCSNSVRDGKGLINCRVEWGDCILIWVSSPHPSRPAVLFVWSVLGSEDAGGAGNESALREGLIIYIHAKGEERRAKDES